MKYTFFPTKDSTIYSHSESINTGNDPILELIKEDVNVDLQTSQSSRIVMGFDWTAASASLSKLPSFNTKFDLGLATAKLKLNIASAKNVPFSYKLTAFPIKQSWEMGIGKFDHNPKTVKGVSWNYRDYSGSTAWTTAGGTFHSASMEHQTQSFEFKSADVEIDISASVALWQTGLSSSADGIILAFTSSQEVDSLEYGSLQFFSRDTNTIYSPRIEIGWESHTIDSGSLLNLTTDEIMVYVKNNKYEYKEDELARFQIRCRDIYPTQTYGTSSAALKVSMLPTTSFYAINDAETEETVISFDGSTRLSVSPTGNYFDFHMGALTAERLYKLILKVEDRNYGGQVEHFDSNHLFKVTR